MHEQTFEERLARIEARNKNVELDKAWETSLARRALLTLFTYLALGLYMWAIDISRPVLNSGGWVHDLDVYDAVDEGSVDCTSLEFETRVK